MSTPTGLKFVARAAASIVAAGGAFAVTQTFAQNAAQCVAACGGSCTSMPAQYVNSCHNACVYRCLHGGEGGAPESFGSVYVTNNGSGAYGFSNAWKNQFDAMDYAKKRCRSRHGGACYRLLVFSNKCAAVVYAKDGDQILGISGSAEPMQRDADDKATDDCRRHHPQASCVIVERFCSK